MDISANIPNGATAVVPTDKVVLTFDGNVDAATISMATVIVTADGTPISVKALETEGKNVIITFDGVMEYNTEYSIQVKANVMLQGDEKHYYYPPITFKTDVEEFENDELMLFNSEGKQLTSLKDFSGTVTAKTRFKNNKIDSTQKMFVTLALYKVGDGYEQMTAIAGKAMSLGKSDEDKLEKDFVIPSDGGKYMIRMYAWESLSSRMTVYSYKAENY